MVGENVCFASPTIRPPPTRIDKRRRNVSMEQVVEVTTHIEKRRRNVCVERVVEIEVQQQGLSYPPADGIHHGRTFIEFNLVGQIREVNTVGPFASMRKCFRKELL